MTEWILPALVLAAPMLTLLGAVCYRAGLRDGLAARREKAAPARPAAGAVAPAQGAPDAQDAQDAQERRLARILANIDAYDGTDAHQIDP